MTTIVSKGDTQYMSVGSVVSPITFAPSITNTFRITNTSGSDMLFVGVFNDANVAAAMTIPSAFTSSPGVVAIAPRTSEFVGGNFGAQNTETIYIAALTGGSVEAYVTPVA